MKELSILGYKVLVNVTKKATGVGIKGLPRVNQLQVWHSYRKVADFNMGRWIVNDLPSWTFNKILTVISHLI